MAKKKSAAEATPPRRIRVAVERAPEPLAVEAEHGTTWKVVVRPLGETRLVVLESAGSVDGSFVERTALAGLVRVESALCADGSPVGMTDGRPATDASTWPAMLAAFPALALAVRRKARELGAVEEERGN